MFGMTSFESLPIEIQALIIFENSLKEISSFFSTNKSFYLLSKQYQHLLAHKLKKQRTLSSISGFIDHCGQFRIKSASFTSEHIINRGKLAQTFQRSELIDYCWKIYIPLSDPNASTVSRDRLIQCIRSQLRNNDAINFSDYKLKCYYQWLRLTQSQLCDLLQKYLT